MKRGVLLKGEFPPQRFGLFRPVRHHRAVVNPLGKIDDLFAVIAQLPDNRVFVVQKRYSAASKNFG